MSQSIQLYRLQQADTALDQRKKRLKEIEAALRDDTALRSAETAFQAAESALQEAEAALRKAEATTKSQRLKIQQTESQLFGGKVRNPKILQDLQQESAALKRYLDVIEERQLEAMLIVDEAKETHEAANNKLGDTKAKRIEQHAALNGEKSRLLVEVVHLESERGAAANTIPGDIRELYEALRKKSRGVAVIRVENNTCGACGTTLNSSLLQEARSPLSLTRCDTCNRILYVTS